jgi:rare lipoprotein A
MRNARLRRLVVVTHVTLWMAPVAAWADPWYTEKGLASYYGKGFAGRPTANGETFSPADMTAAHRHLPLGTKVLVENLETGAQTEVKINDRGPYADTKRRILDLSRAAADSIGLVERGVGQVTLTVTEPAAPPKNGTDADYTVQVGIFAEAAAAQDVLVQLQERYPTAYMEQRHGPKGPYYRLRIGPFETEAHAQRVAKTLKREGHMIFLDAVPDTPHTER